MCAQSDPETRSAGSRTDAVLSWLGGGRPGVSGERSPAVSAVVLLVAVLAWLIATLAVAGSTTWPVPAILPLTLVFAVLVGAVTRATASGPIRGRGDLIGRGAVAVALGVVVGELAALVLFSSSVNRMLDDQAARHADASPAVADLDRAREARAALDTAVDEARTHRDESLVVARCEFNPSPDCPETHITGVPGDGPETRTADDLLAGAQREFDDALAARDSQAAGLDAQIADGEQAVAQAHATAVAAADRGFGARWVAMNDHTFASASALLLRVLTIAFCVLLALLPLIIRFWRAETGRGRVAVARDEQERAELAADTAIAVKRAELRAATEIMWAEQQLANARLTSEAQLEIDREQQRRRVAEVLDAPVRTVSRRESTFITDDAVIDEDDDMYLPIAAAAAAAAEAACPAPPALPAAPEPGRIQPEPEVLPAQIETAGAVEAHEQRRGPLIPSIPDVTKAVPEVARTAARWVRPVVPPFVAGVVDAATQPLRTVRQVFDEVEEITFSLKRSHKVTVDTEVAGAADVPVAPHQPEWVESPVAGAYPPYYYDAYAPQPGVPAEPLPWAGTAAPVPVPATGLAAGSGYGELPAWDGPYELPGPYGPPQLPPAQ